MLAQSQGRNEQVVNSFNLFIDSAKDVGGAVGKGDNFSLQLGADSIEARDGQFLRLTLTDFSMYTNFYGVNINNSKFRLTNDVTSTSCSRARITRILPISRSPFPPRWRRSCRPTRGTR